MVKASLSKTVIGIFRGKAITSTIPHGTSIGNWVWVGNRWAKVPLDTKALSQIMSKYDKMLRRLEASIAGKQQKIAVDLHFIKNYIGRKIYPEFVPFRLGRPKKVPHVKALTLAEKEATKKYRELFRGSAGIILTSGAIFEIFINIKQAAGQEVAEFLYNDFVDTLEISSPEGLTEGEFDRTTGKQAREFIYHLDSLADKKVEPLAKAVKGFPDWWKVAKRARPKTPAVYQQAIMEAVQQLKNGEVYVRINDWIFWFELDQLYVADVIDTIDNVENIEPVDPAIYQHWTTIFPQLPQNWLPINFSGVDPIFGKKMPIDYLQDWLVGEVEKTFK